MSAIRLFLRSGALVALLTTSAFAQNAGIMGDRFEGEKLAREWCARCHNVETDGPFKQHPPSFASIAVYRSADQIHGRIMFPPFHSNMPKIGYMLTLANVNDLIAYITSLEPQ